MKNILFTVALTLVSVNVFAARLHCPADKLVCDSNGSSAEICLGAKGEMILPTRAILNINDSLVSAMIKSEYNKVDGHSAVDSTKKYTLSFRIDGFTFDRKPRLSIAVEKGAERTFYTSCLTTKPQRTHAF